MIYLFRLLFTRIGILKGISNKTRIEMSRLLQVARHDKLNET